MLLDALSAAEIIYRLGLAKLEAEGGYYRGVQRDEFGSAIYFLLTPDQFSAWHRLAQGETWTLIAGEALNLHLYARQYQKIELSRAEFCLSHSVLAGQWMAAETRGKWSLLLCHLAPPFSGLEMAPHSLVDSWCASNPGLPRLVYGQR